MLELTVSLAHRRLVCAHLHRWLLNVDLHLLCSSSVANATFLAVFHGEFAVSCDIEIACVCTRIKPVILLNAILSHICWVWLVKICFVSFDGTVFCDLGGFAGEAGFEVHIMRIIF